MCSWHDARSFRAAVALAVRLQTADACPLLACPEHSASQSALQDQVQSALQSRPPAFAVQRPAQSASQLPEQLASMSAVHWPMQETWPFAWHAAVTLMGVHCALQSAST